MTSRSPVHGDFIAHPPWTARQRQVLDLLARGRTNPEIAEELGISLDGAKWHVREIIGTLGVDSREEAADLWREENGLVRRVFRGIAGVLGMFAGPAGWVAGGLVATGVAAIVVLAIVVATRGSNPPPALAPGPSATATILTTATPEPSTGNAQVDAVLAAIRDRDSDSLQHLVQFTDRSCETTPISLPSAPTCQAGEEPGSDVPAFLVIGCPAGHYARSSELPSVV
ncbi:MAG TPA: helix-turn-helix transcriptional regulator, partial [Tepidiformaceae bacterium]|nr:helix-turn-helix transcriptional regulator [Tepidiformaceae bacterium]